MYSNEEAERIKTLLMACKSGTAMTDKFFLCFLKVGHSTYVHAKFGFRGCHL